MFLFSEIKKNKDKLFVHFTDIKNIINIKVMKCFRTLFNIEAIKNNLGNYILLTIIFINICLLFAFLIKGFNIFKEFVNKITPTGETLIENIKIKNAKKINNIKPQIKKIKNKNGKNKIKFIKFKGKNTQIINYFNINKSNKNNKSIKTKNKSNKKNNFPPKKFGANNRKKDLKKKINTLKKIKENKNLSLSSKLHLNEKLRKQNNINIFILNKNSRKEINNNFYERIKTYNDYELNSLNYELAVMYDKRSFIEFYCSLLKRRQLLIFTFCIGNDYNSKLIKACLFFFSFSLYFTVNALFFNDLTMHKIYEGKGNFNIIHRISQIFYSSIISSFLQILIKFFSLSEKNIISLRYAAGNIKEKILSVLKCLKIKFFFFYLFLFLFLSLFWYYISCFCAIYKNTQKILIKDTLMSFGLSMLYSFFLSVLPGIFRIPALKNKNNCNECLYQFSKILQLL